MTAFRPAIPARRRGRRAPQGMTLLELMVVVSITGVLAAMALPSLRGAVEQSRARSGAEVVRATLLRARNEARLRHVCIQLRLENTAQAIRVTRKVHAGCDARALMDGVVAGDYTTEADIENADELGGVTETQTDDLKDGSASGGFLARVAAAKTVVFGPLGSTFLQEPTLIEVVERGTTKRLARFQIFPATGIVREAR